MVELTASGEIASFKSVASVPLSECKCSFQPVQEGTGNPSPSNVRNITGNTGLTISACGKNLFDESTKESGYISASGAIVSDPSSCHSKLIKVKSGETYTFSGHATGTATGTGNKRFHGYNENGEWVSQLSYESVSARTEKWYSVSATIPNNVKYVAISYLVNDQSVMVAKESSRSTYEPYSVRVFPVNWATEAGTVYGGTLDLVTGVLTATWMMRDLGAIGWSEGTATNYQFFVTGNITSKALNYNFICSRYKAVAKGRTSLSNNEIGVYHTDEGYRKRFAVRDDSCATLADFIEATDGVQVAYELLNPVEYQLSPQQVKAIIGQNNIWNNIGETEVKLPFGESSEMLEIRRRIMYAHKPTPPPPMIGIFQKGYQAVLMPDSATQFTIPHNLGIMPRLCVIEIVAGTETALPRLENAFIDFDIKGLRDDDTGGFGYWYKNSNGNNSRAGYIPSEKITTVNETSIVLAPLYSNASSPWDASASYKVTVWG